MPVATHPLLDSFSALADPTRCRALLLLEGHELTVTELCAVLQLPQSTVSRHLKTLGDAGFVTSRRDGTSRYYTLGSETTPGVLSAEGTPGAVSPHGQIWQLARQQLLDRPTAAQDARRLARVLARRSETSQQFFASAAGQWDKLREDLFGRTFSFRALLALIDADLVVGDLGCGTGVVSAALAPNVARVVGVDASDEMLHAAHERVAAFTNVDLKKGTLESLPIASASLDAAVMMLVLHHVPSPANALTEAARVLKPGGRLLIVDMAPHEHEEYRQQMGHVWLGFSDEQMTRLLTQAGLSRVKIQALATATEAKGPGLFGAVATRQATAGSS